MPLEHYAGVFVYDPKDFMVLCVSDSEHPQEVKMAGGMSVAYETPEQTVYREATQELRTQILDMAPVFVEAIPSRGGIHKRHFFLALRIAGAIEKGTTWTVKEENHMTGKVEEELTAQWVSFPEFVERLFFKQHPAFGAVLAKLGELHPQLLQSEKFRDLMVRFPRPKDLGLTGAR